MSDDPPGDRTDELLELHRRYKALVLELQSLPRGSPERAAKSQEERDLARRIFAVVSDGLDRR